jgi:hypothetical protein
MLRRIALVFLAVVSTGSVFAQMAPRETVTAQIGGAKVSVEYGRPSLKGRSFDELVSKLPGDRMWRAGSEQITTLTTTAPLVIGGRMVPTGKYSLYVQCPESGPYALAVNTVLGQPLKDLWSEAPANLANEPWPHMNYQEIQGSEVARIPLKESKASASVDLFTITITEGSGGAKLSLAWGDQSWSADIKSAGSEGSHREGS